MKNWLLMKMAMCLPAIVTFEVKEDGSVTKVEMKDEYSKVEISKTDISTGKELEGAKLQIIRKDGTVLEEWITDGKPHSVAKASGQ